MPARGKMREKNRTASRARASGVLDAFPHHSNHMRPLDGSVRPLAGAGGKMRARACDGARNATCASAPHTRVKDYGYRTPSGPRLPPRVRVSDALRAPRERERESESEREKKRN